MPWRYDSEGNVVVTSSARPTAEFDAHGERRSYVLERAFFADYALICAAKGDRHGNLVFNASARNFNPLAAMSARVAIVEVEELVEVGDIGPDSVHHPGCSCTA